jgi:abortive infection bacteriophage resistance protein
MKYQKPALSITQQIAHWEAKGLIIQDQAAAQAALCFIGLFRLKGYALPFMVQTANGRQFNPGTTLEQVLALYQFDRELRVMVMRELECIEVAIRTVISNTLSESQNDPFWYMDPKKTILGDIVKGVGNVIQFDRARFLAEVDTETRRSKDEFARHYFRKYTDPALPPSWVASECLSFGKWSRLYQHLKVGKTPIASTFNLGVDVLESWLHCLTYFRNVCAHHGMVCRRKFVFRPKTLNREKLHFAQNQSFYCYAAVIQVLLKSMQPQPEWPTRLKQHFNNYPNISPTEMGFPANWDAMSLWT